MGGCVSLCAKSADEQPQAVESDLFASLPRDPLAPGDLFAPLDIHFARHHSLANLLTLYPSRRLPSDLVQCIWLHYFEHELHPPRLPATSRSSIGPPGAHSAATTTTAHTRALTPTTAGRSRRHNHPPLPLSPSHSATAPVHPASSAHYDGALEMLRRNSSNASTNSARCAVALAAATSPSAPVTPVPPHESAAELLCMQRLLTDILRFDLRALKERYDEVLAASLAMPSESDIRAPRERATSAVSHQGVSSHPDSPGHVPLDGFRFNPAPVLAALRVDLQRLHSMPLDYLARLVVTEIKGSGSGELQGSTPHSPHSLERGLGGAMHPAGSGDMSPLDKPVLAPSLPTSLAPLPAPLPPPLNYVAFAAHIDVCLRALFDRFYRKGFWILFSLNLMHHAASIMGGSGAAATSASARAYAAMTGVRSRAGGGAWSERVSAAVVANEQDVVRTRKGTATADTHSRATSPVHTPQQRLPTRGARANNMADLCPTDALAAPLGSASLALSACPQTSPMAGVPPHRGSLLRRPSVSLSPLSPGASPSPGASASSVSVSASVPPTSSPPLLSIDGKAVGVGGFKLPPLLVIPRGDNAASVTPLMPIGMSPALTSSAAGTHEVSNSNTTCTRDSSDTANPPLTAGTPQSSGAVAAAALDAFAGPSSAPSSASGMSSLGSHVFQASCDGSAGVVTASSPGSTKRGGVSALPRLHASPLTQIQEMA